MFLNQVTVPKELVAVMSAKGTGSHDDPQNPEKKIYTFTQKVKVFISTFYQLRMILMLHIVTSKNSSENMFTMFSLPFFWCQQGEFI